MTGRFALALIVAGRKAGAAADTALVEEITFILPTPSLAEPEQPRGRQRPDVSSPTAPIAAAQLDRLSAKALVTISRFQVDCVSEFRAEFDHACSRNIVKLYVVPP